MTVSFDIYGYVHRINSWKWSCPVSLQRGGEKYTSFRNEWKYSLGTRCCLGAAGTWEKAVGMSGPFHCSSHRLFSFEKLILFKPQFLCFRLSRIWRGNKHLLRCYYVPGIGLGQLQVSSLNSCRTPVNYPQFTDENQGSERLGNFPRATQWIHGDSDFRLCQRTRDLCGSHSSPHPHPHHHHQN